MKKISKGITLFMLLCISTISWSQTKTVIGKIVAENGDAVVNASVSLKNIKTGVVTNNSGEFSITVPSTAKTLVVSSVGYETKESPILDGSLLITLTKIVAKMDEVVVVGYGTQKRSVVTGAISKVTARDLEKVPSGGIGQILQGRTPGVTVMQNSGQPGSASTIRVRGVTTFNYNEPLYVVDGVVVDAGGIGYINQADIESVEVLKDATSQAIYGTRAAPGVIMVTTKKGKSGKLSVGYNGYVGTSAPAKVLSLLNATQYGALMNERSVAGGGAVLYPDLSVLGKGTDWQNEIFNYGAKRSNHEISLSGGTDKSTFFMSFGYQNNEGIVATDISNFEKYSARLNSTHKIGKIFTLTQTLGYTYSKQNSLGNTNSEFGGPLSSAINLDPTIPLFETDPTKLANLGLYPTGNALVGPALKDANGNVYGIGLGMQEMSNPLAYTQTKLGQYGYGNDIVGNLSLEAAVTKEIKLKSVVSAKLAFWGAEGFTPTFYLGSGGGLSNAINSMYKEQHHRRYLNIENTATYTKNWKQNHNFTILLGQSAYKENVGGGNGFSFQGLPVNSYKDASFSFFSAATSVYSASAYSTEGNPNNNWHILSSLFGRVNYNYKEKYLLTGIWRRDGSNRFGANNKFGYFPGASLGWVVSKEDFWKANKYVNSLKIRGGYGKTGNDGLAEYSYLSLIRSGYNYTIGNSNGINAGNAPNTLDNPDVHWETTKQLNFGFEARLFNSLDLSVDYYKKKTSDILRQVTIPGYVGVPINPFGNVANMDNSGIEIEINYRRKLGPVNFSASGNMATLKNKVTYIASDADFIAGYAGFQSMGTVTRIQVGQSFNSFFGYQTAGIFQNQAEIDAYKNSTGGLIQPNARPGDFKWVDANGDGTISNDDKDKVFLGTSLPKITFGLTLNFDYKGFDLMAFANGAAGNKIFQGLRRLDIAKANYQTVAMSRWTGEGTSNSYPRLTSTDPNGNFGKMSDFYLEKGDYLRLKVLQLGYTLAPNKVLNKIGANKLRVYVSAENLLTLTKYTGYDPEVGGSVYGIDKGQYPQARSFMVGAQLQF
ncbi:MAG: TonB-dependent receptor [Ferruginibacter sp.]|nr:TonB-dependent receptor [Ferruginibacter sp.]